MAAQVRRHSAYPIGVPGAVGCAPFVRFASCVDIEADSLFGSDFEE